MIYSRLSVACDLDYFGPGAGVEFGIATNTDSDELSGRMRLGALQLYAVLKLRLAAAFGLD